MGRQTQNRMTKVKDKIIIQKNLAAHYESVILPIELQVIQMATGKIRLSGRRQVEILIS